MPSPNSPLAAGVTTLLDVARDAGVSRATASTPGDPDAMTEMIRPISSVVIARASRMEPNGSPIRTARTSA